MVGQGDTERKSSSSGPVLITGCPRSGTTFVGSVFEAAPDIFEIYEPFNGAYSYNLNLPGRLFRITDENAAEFRPRLDRMMELASLGKRISMLPHGVWERRKPKKHQELASTLSLKKLYRNPPRFFSGRRLSLKDPMAFFSAEWLARTYDMHVVVMVRHPAGAISSFDQLGWPAETPDIVDYELPLSKGAFDREIAEWRANRGDRLGELILQWKLFTRHTLDLKQLYPHWTFALHEDVCARPDAMFRQMFADAGVPFGPEVEARIRTSTTANAADPNQPIQHRLERNSAALVDSWKTKVPKEQLDRILSETQDLWAETRRELERFPHTEDMAK
ncbi:MAG: sulfotransferase [Hyphomonas sp.]|uniref:sulfotransferase n=1 Tax=Hyphomonas sp. TaxID=87 RepID=UPI003528575C